MNKKKKGCIPRLRFPEFQDIGEWEITPLKILATKQAERNNDNKLVRVFTNSAEYGVIDQKDYFNKAIAVPENLNYYFIINKGDFVYNPRVSAFAPVGPISMNNIGKGVMSPLYTIFRFNNPDNKFYAHYFKSSAWHSYMRQVGSTGARHDRMAISNNDFMAMPLPTPLREEQQKIANCLSSLDKVINLETEKLEIFKSHKKGLMQQLFPREGETTPRLRFPEFRDMRACELKPLGKLSLIVRGGSPRPISNYLTTKKDALNWLKIGDVDQNAKYVYFTNEKIIKSALSKTREVKPGDLIMSNSMSFGRPYILKIKACIHDGWIAITNISNHINLEYLYYYILSPIGQNYFRDAAAGGGVKNLNADIIKQLSIYFPKQLEQQKIANCFSSLDRIIDLQIQKLDTLKNHKKGLMQQLFPQEV